MLKTALWKASFSILYAVDLLFPLITRTLFQYFTCRDLKGAGRWLEADHSVDCDDPKYSQFRPFVGIFAFFWTVGVPSCFLYLVYRYKHHGHRGDRVVSGALAWMCA